MEIGSIHIHIPPRHLPQLVRGKIVSPTAPGSIAMSLVALCTSTMRLEPAGAVEQGSQIFHDNPHQYFLWRALMEEERRRTEDTDMLLSIRSIPNNLCVERLDSNRTNGQKKIG